MIKEFALEPSLLNNWKDFRYFVEKFGIPQGRLISKYPKRWKRLVYDSLSGCAEIERKRIEEQLSSIDTRLISRTHEFDPLLDWGTNAENEHLIRPFHAIIAKNNPRTKSFVLEAESICDSNSLWNISRSKIIKRSADEISGCVEFLILNSREVMLIDPYFAPDKLSYRRTLEAIIMLTVGGHKRLPSKFEIHLKDYWGNSHFENECRRLLSPLVPREILIKLYRWRDKPNGDKLHNRYILSDLGGIRFGSGLCEGCPEQTDEVELLEETIVRQRLANYSLESPAFDLVDVTSVQGTRSIC